MLLSRALLAFVAVAEELHFGRAALRLHVSQPPLSQQIRQLESSLGVALFVRSTRSVQLTPAGRLLLERAHRLRADAEGTVHAAQRIARGEAGRLTLGFTHSTVYRVLPAVLTAYRARCPEVALELRQFTSDLLMAEVHAGRIDMALLRLSDAMRAPELEVVQVARDPMVLVLPAGHALMQGRSVAAAALDGLPFIGYAPNGARYFHDLVDRILALAEVRTQVVQHSILPTMLALVQAGMGAALVPKSVITARHGSDLAWRPLRPRRGVARAVWADTTQATLHGVHLRDNANPACATFATVLAAVARSAASCASR